MVDENKIQFLITRAKRGDSSAFGEIYDELSPSVFNFLLTRVRHKQLAEDLLQTVFLKAWKNLETYRRQKTAKFTTWLFQIANFTLIDYWRTKKEIVELEKIDNLMSFAENPSLYEQYDYLWSAILKLPDEYQTVLNLRFKEDLSVAETAYIMNKSEISIRVMQHRALKMLRSKLGNNIKVQ